MSFSKLNLICWDLVYTLYLINLDIRLNLVNLRRLLNHQSLWVNYWVSCHRIILGLYIKVWLNKIVCIESLIRRILLELGLSEYNLILNRYSLIEVITELLIVVIRINLIVVWLEIIIIRDHII